MSAAIDGSFVNNFWGKDESGSQIVFNRMTQGHKTCEELMEFYQEKIQIEQEYAMKLQKLSKKNLGNKETGTIKFALDTLKKEFGNISQAHLKEVKDIENEILAPLAVFTGSFEKDRIEIEKITSSVISSKQKLYRLIEQNKARYSNDCIKLYNLYSKGGSNQEKIQKLESQLHKSRQAYESSINEYKQVLNTWIKQWQTAANDLQDLEIERMNYLKTNIWNLLNVTATTCVQDDKCCENVRMALENCDSLNDIKSFVESFKTGDEIYHAPEFVDFMSSTNSDHKPDISLDLEADTSKYSKANFENSFSSINSAAQFGDTKHLKFKSNQQKRTPQCFENKSINKQVTFTSSTNAGSSYYGDSLMSRKNEETKNDELYNEVMAKVSENPENKFEKEFESLHFHEKDKELNSISKNKAIQIKSPFGTIQTISSSKAKQTSPTLSNGAFSHQSDTASYTGSSDNHSLGRQSTNASSHTSSNFSTNSNNNKTWSSPTRRRSKMGNWTESPKKVSDNTSITNSLPPPNQRVKDEKQAQLNRYYEQNKNDDSILNTSTMRNFNPEEVGVDDPLRAALEDLKIGGNGDFNALKERHNSIKSNNKSNKKDFLYKDSTKRKSFNNLQQQKDIEESQISQTRINNKASIIRPKSMIEIAEMNMSKPISQHVKSLSSTNTKSVPLAPNGLPLISTNGRPVLRHAKAIYEYSASIPAEVSFKRKDLMLILAMQDDGWWEVEVLNNKEGRFGLAPSNYLIPA